MFDDRLTDPLGLLTVLSVRGVGPATAEKIVRAFPTLRALHEADPASCKGVMNKSLVESFAQSAVMWTARDAAQSILSRANDLGVQVVTAFSEAYPERFARSEDRPLLLYVRGDLSASDRTVGVVGSREPSRFGEVVARKLTDFLADTGWAPATTLINGVAGIAQECALDRGLATVGVISGGHDLLMSERQEALAERIVANGGCVVGEHAFGYEPEQGSIIRCHRIITGLSAGTVVVQAATGDMSMQAARYAVMQGRPLYAPVATGDFAADPLNAGPLLLAQGNGMDLVGAIGAKGALVDLVTARYMDTPLANPLASRDDYPEMVAAFEASCVAVGAETEAPAFA